MVTVTVSICELAWRTLSKKAKYESGGAAGGGRGLGAVGPGAWQGGGGAAQGPCPRPAF